MTCSRSWFVNWVEVFLDGYEGVSGSVILWLVY